MNSKRIALIILAIVIIAATAAGGFYVGKSKQEKIMNDELLLNVKLNLSELEGLGEIEGPIYITGHKSPDTDTVCSAIAYAQLLQTAGLDARAVVLGNVNKETAYILKAAGEEKPPQLEDASGKNMILMDHSEYSHDLDSLADAKILCVVDHHGVGSITTGNQLIYDARPLGATATIVWLRGRNYGLEPDAATATILMGAILSDTMNLKSNTTTFADKEAVRILSGTAGIKDVDAFYNEMHKEFLSHEGMTDEEIFFDDYKEYEAGGTKYSIACVNCFDETEAKDIAERIVEPAKESLAKTGMDMAFAQISVFNEDVSVNYLVPSGEGAEEALITAFGDKLSHEGSAYVLRPGISRKKDLVPALTEVLQAHPKE